jgi:nitrite reductase (NO-forming)
MLAAFFAAAICSMALAVCAAVAYALSGPAWLHWLSLHLVFLGGISQLVLGAGQFFVCAFLATDPPSRVLTRAQLAVWNLGTLLVAVGVPAGSPAAVYAGAVLIAGGLILFALAMREMERRSLQRAPWALRWYQASAAFLGVGALAGVLMAVGARWPYGSLLGAHLALNLGGWLGTAIVGTLHTFFPSLTQTQLRHPRLQPATFLLWIAGIVDLAAGAAFTHAGLLLGGWAELLLAAALLSVNLAASVRDAGRPLGLPARLLVCAQLFLCAGLLLALLASAVGGVAAPFEGEPAAALAVLLLAGWIGLTVAGSLLHLLAILARVRQRVIALPRARPIRDRVLTMAATIAIAALALSRAPGLRALATPAGVLVLAVAAALAAGVLGLARRALSARDALPGARS